MGDTGNFTIRVYALIIDDSRRILLSDEYQLDIRMTKFPGGGLKYGEGPVDCLKREALEEFGQPVEVTSHFYTTDFFQPALFFKDTQVINIYYLAEFTDEIQFVVSEKPFDYNSEANGAQSFRWYPIEKLSEDTLTLPIDKIVAKQIINKYSASDD